MTGPALVWFRDDYRVADHPALQAAVASRRPLLCCAILDEESPGLRPLGGAARWWLHGSLAALDERLRALGSELCLFSGAAAEVIETIVAATGAEVVTFNRRYLAAEIAVDREVEARLAARGVTVETFNGRLLNEPWEIGTKGGTPFKVFTPYLRAIRAKGGPPKPLPAPRTLKAASPAKLKRLRVSLRDLALEPEKPDWAAPLAPLWVRGEKAARARLSTFLDEQLLGYTSGRDRPGLEGTARLSPHLRFGEIGPRQIWHAVASATASGRPTAPERDAEKFISEVLWREFSYQLLHTFPYLSEKPYDSRFARMPWRRDPVGLRAWRTGRTGYPIVDAGMRQLWRTGWMHNRVRMIAASFLVKHLLIDWRDGERWFWDTLVDADPANNAFGWQWVTGSGPDAAPFFRVFNPVAQGRKFDPAGTYVRAFVPELARLPDAFVHRPWQAPADVLAAAGVVLGETYPGPIVPHESARERALAAFRSTRDRGG